MQGENWRVYAMNRVNILISKLLGLKGFIWITSTALLWFGKIAGSEWMMLSMAVCGFQVAQKWQGDKGGFNVGTVDRTKQTSVTTHGGNDSPPSRYGSADATTQVSAEYDSRTVVTTQDSERSYRKLGDGDATGERKQGSGSGESLESGD